MGIKLVKGQDKTILATWKSTKTKQPINLSTLVSAELWLRKSDSTAHKMDLTNGIAIVGNAVLGVLSYTFEGDTLTPLLKDGSGLSMEFMIETGVAAAGDPANKVYWKILNDLTVEKRVLSV